MENGMEFPQKTPHRTTKWSSNPTPGHRSRQNYNSKRYMQPYVQAALFTITKIWKQSKCPSTDVWVKMRYINIKWLIYFITQMLYVPFNPLHLFHPAPHCPPLATTRLFPVSVTHSVLFLFIHLFLHFSCKWSHTVFIFLCLTYFTQHNTL